jgi:DNA-binding NtrC family response regulator
VGHSETKRRQDSATSAEAPAASEAHLLVVFPRGQRALHGVATAGLTLGRASAPQKADLGFDDACMSRLHARLTRGATSWHLIDQGSSNGSFVNGCASREAEAAPLTDGAVLRLGDTLLVFRQTLPARFDDLAAAEQTNFPGVSPAAVAIRQQLRELLNTSGHVLIVGETGTGKERASRTFERPGQPFVPVNCAELRKELARAELFGHERGAFTGAISTKLGLVKEAGDGVLFLDEVGELPLDAQGDLLRFLEDGSYRLVGSNGVKKSSARVVAATNVDLDQAVQARTFRRDLLARLRAHNAMVELPPLRERREDILGWADYFTREAGGKTVNELWTAGAAECLLLYPWPENLRELRGLVRSLLTKSALRPLQRADLPAALQAHCRSLRSTTPNSTATPISSAPPNKQVRAPERVEIEAILAETRGNVQVTAQKLNINRRQLYHLRDRFGIDIAKYRGGDGSGDGLASELTREASFRATTYLQRESLSLRTRPNARSGRFTPPIKACQS